MRFHLSIEELKTHIEHNKDVQNFENEDNDKYSPHDLSKFHLTKSAINMRLFHNYSKTIPE